MARMELRLLHLLLLVSLASADPKRHGHHHRQSAEVERAQRALLERLGIKDGPKRHHMKLAEIPIPQFLKEQYERRTDMEVRTVLQRNMFHHD